MSVDETAPEESLVRNCPECGHYTAQAIFGKCTVFVPGSPVGPLVEYCGHDCYRAMTGRSLIEEIASNMWGEEQ